MATGISKNAFNEASTLALLKHKNPYPKVPNVPIELSYKNKLAEFEVLKPLISEFIDVGGNKLKVNIEGSDLVLGDNIFALHQMIKQNTKVDLIYLDPPYNTGMDFESRSQEHAYNDSFAIASYLEDMRIRLILMREILSDQGSLYLHIGHQMMPYLKVILDEVFGAKNCRNIITRRKCSSKNSTKNQYANLNDYILFYTKTNNYIWNPQGEKPSDEWIQKEYPKVDSKGQYKLVPIHAPGKRNGSTGTEWRGKMPPEGKHWQYTPDKLDALDEAGEIHWSKTGNPRRKVYLTNDKKLPYNDYWADFRDAHHQSVKITGYPTEKNLHMLKMIVAASSNPNSLVLDPFCGSGTTLQASAELGRQWIGMDQSFTAMKYSINRLTKGTKEMGDYVLSKHTSQLNLIETENLHSFRLLVDKDVYVEYQDQVDNLL